MTLTIQIEKAGGSMTSSWKRLFALLLALTLVAAACGSDDAGTEETEATAAATETTEATESTEAMAEETESTEAMAEETESTEAMADEPLKIAFVHVGPVADKGWSWAHDQGAQYVKDALGDGVEITTLEIIPEGPDIPGHF